MFIVLNVDIKLIYYNAVLEIIFTFFLLLLVIYVYAYRWYQSKYKTVIKMMTKVSLLWISAIITPYCSMDFDSVWWFTEMIENLKPTSI